MNTAICLPELDSAMRQVMRNTVLEGTDVFIEENEDQVILSGSVPSFYVKQAAQEALRSHIGIRRLRNNLQVCRD